MINNDAALVETLLSSEQMFDGHLLKVYRDRVVLPSGDQANREFIRHPGACVIVPELEPGVLLFERQFRYPANRIFIEFPAGKIDPNESTQTCAERELAEETGYRANCWTRLGCIHPCVGYSDEQIEIFLAQGLVHGTQQLDHGEFLELVTLTTAQAHQAILNGDITDAKTIAALFFAREKLSP
jgi:ADP-ribose pyrophosphatase